MAERVMGRKVCKASAAWLRVVANGDVAGSEVPRTPRGPPHVSATGLVDRGAGDGLLSRGLATGVPSALSGLTTVFGMGTGVALTLESPAKSVVNAPERT